MLGLGFHYSWVRKIMGCIETISYHLIQNREYMGPIKPSRGLRQASSIQALEKKRTNPWLQSGTGGLGDLPSFLCDDSYMFFKADAQEGYQVKHCLEQYEKASNQTVNFEKSTISFSSNVSNQLKGEIRS